MVGLGRTGALTRQVTTQKIYHGTHETHENQRRSDATLMAEKNITVGEESFLPSSCLSFHFVGFVGTSYCMDTLSASADISWSHGDLAVVRLSTAPLKPQKFLAAKDRKRAEGDSNGSLAPIGARNSDDSQKTLCDFLWQYGWVSGAWVVLCRTGALTRHRAAGGGTRSTICCRRRQCIRK